MNQYPHHHGDWAKIADQIVNRTLAVQSGERVLVWADPTLLPELTEQVRIAIVRAGAIEVATMILQSPALEQHRKIHRRREDPELKGAEDDVLRRIFDTTDVFIWLPNRWAHNILQSEDIMRNWPGRSVHFHWVPGWWPWGSDPALFEHLSRMYEEALDIDYTAMADKQRRAIELLTDSTVHVTTPRGTDLTFRLSGAHFHRNDGDASHETVAASARAGSSRDREEELPAGVIRTVDISHAQGTLVVPNETYPAWTGRFVGDMHFDFDNDRIISFKTQHNQAYVDAMWALEVGQKDRIGEFVIGFNPALKVIPGHEDDGILPYFGFGEGIVRFSMGYNVESGGENESSFLHNWLYLTDATVTANGTPVLEDGHLVLPERN
jgi:leucyl aminopeptidase (aminopeptidase T)